MDCLCRWISPEPDLARWERGRFSAAVDEGPRSHDNQDHHERVIGWEASGSPENHGIARRVADAILRFDVASAATESLPPTNPTRR